MACFLLIDWSPVISMSQSVKQSPFKFKTLDGSSTIPFLPTTMSLSGTRENLRAKDEYTLTANTAAVHFASRILCRVSQRGYGTPTVGLHVIHSPASATLCRYHMPAS